MKFGMCLCLAFLAGGLPAAEIVITTNSARTNSPTPVPILRTNVFKGLRLKPGFRVELVASEPLVINPGPMAFDENGRLFVLETPPGQPGRVRLLEDTAGDGVLNSSRIYADNLYGPTALACYDGGVFVGASGQIIYLKDTKNDGEVDMRRVVFSSFGDATNGVNGAVIFSTIIWGMDNRFHVATAGLGGDVISSSSPKQSIVLSGGCFSFDPRTFALADESGFGPSGMALDNRGRRFVSSPVQHIQMVMYESRYAARNPYFKMPDVLFDMGGHNIIYPAVATGQPLPVRFFDAYGLTFYRGYLFPLDYVDNPFVADTAANVVHNDKLRASNLELFAERAPDEPNAEFLTVSDNSFQPVAFAGGPEGALYVAGPAREPAVSPPARNANTNSPVSRGFGRIYRIVPVNFKQPPLTHFARAAVTDLVNALRHSDGWHRDSADRLLYERQDKAAIVPLIQLLFDSRSPPLGRIYALHALDGLGTLVPGHIMRALSDLDERVREHGVLLSEKFLNSGMTFPDAIWGALVSLSGDPSPQVRYQLAFTLGQCRNSGRVQTLADTLRTDPNNRWMQAAVFSSLNEGSEEMLGILAADGNFRGSVGGREFLARLAFIAGARNRPDELPRAMTAIAAVPEPEVAFALARRLGDGLLASSNSLATADSQRILQPLYASATRFAADMNAAEEPRVQAVRLLDATGVWDPQLTTVMVTSWGFFTTRLRSEVATALCDRQERTAQMVISIVSLFIPAPTVPPFYARFLVDHPNNDIRQQATLLYGNPANISRQNVVDQFAPALHMAGNRERGGAFFVARCGNCHLSGNDGDFLGFPLKNPSDASRENLLAKIVDPNRDVSPTNSAVFISTVDGSTLSGNLISLNAGAYTLCQPNGELRVLARQNVMSQTPLGISTMPAGLESGLSQQDMADLLEYLAPGSATP
jgi:putative membrane-bound dehydrogenase-like protein